MSPIIWLVLAVAAAAVFYGWSITWAKEGVKSEDKDLAVVLKDGTDRRMILMPKDPPPAARRMYERAGTLTVGTIKRTWTVSVRPSDVPSRLSVQYDYDFVVARTRVDGGFTPTVAAAAKYNSDEEASETARKAVEDMLVRIAARYPAVAFAMGRRKWVDLPAPYAGRVTATADPFLLFNPTSRATPPAIVDEAQEHNATEFFAALGALIVANLPVLEGGIFVKAVRFSEPIRFEDTDLQKSFERECVETAGMKPAGGNKGRSGTGTGRGRP